jgi:hypothetical protein
MTLTLTFHLIGFGDFVSVRWSSGRKKRTKKTEKNTSVKMLRLKHFGKERSARREKREGSGRERERRKEAATVSWNTEYGHGSISFKYPWDSPLPVE